MPAVTERPVEVRAVPQQPGTAPAARTGAQRLAIIAEALAAAALVTAAAATAFTNHDTGPPGRGVGPPVTAGAGAVSPSPDRRVPPPVGWAIVGAYRVPVSATLGPAVVADGLARGFARTTTAAVIAAANIAARTTPEAGPEVFTATIEAQVFDPKGDAFSRAVTAGYQRRHHTGTHGKDPPARLRIATVAGYRIEATEPATPARERCLTGVVLHLLLRLPHRGYRDLRLRVRWLYRDWRLYPPPRNNWTSAMTRVRRLNRYVRFS